MEVLAGDVGGTKTLLAIAEVEGSPGPWTPRSVELQESRRYESGRFSGLAVICRTFAADLGRPLPPYAGFGIAGPVAGGRSHTTNLPWVLDERELASAIGVTGVRLVNDFHALALGVAAVGPAGLVALNEGAREAAGPCAFIGAGTGLGEAIAMIGACGRVEVLATEGGHASFAPRDELELDILRFLMRRYDHVSWERVVSGEGLLNIAEAIADSTGAPLPSHVAELAAGRRNDAPAAITAAARGGDPTCRRAVETFCTLYGAEAGNLALKALATGGVYVAGGIAPKLLPELSDGRFRAAFVAKGRMRPILEIMPVHVVLDENAALMGAAALAADEATILPRTRHIAATTP
jgi:glucokinase